MRDISDSRSNQSSISNKLMKLVSNKKCQPDHWWMKRYYIVHEERVLVKQMKERKKKKEGRGERERGE